MAYRHIEKIIDRDQMLELVDKDLKTAIKI